ncbi:MAG: GNAT family N-acetyltransferase [Anaerolineae bacterium]|nr:GNAT family N-acetyltransferase [Anaerolineae bacterium]
MAIEALCNEARYKLPQMWQWEEYLTAEPFVIVEHGGSAVGAIFAWPDGSTVAWVRMAALSDAMGIDDWLDAALPLVLVGLRRSGTAALAWMDYGGWAGPLLRKRGFKPLTDVVTMAKFDHQTPHTDSTHAHLRPASDADIPAIVAVDRAAFTPHWWHSEDTVRRRAAAAAHFAVAESAGQVVGYAEGELRLPIAHLNRIAVHPAHHGRGIGAALLRDALRAFWRQGAEHITLNTQSDNRESQRLYRRFGFEMTGDFATVWELQL